MYHVSIDGTKTVFFDLLLGTIQGSILGPILFALFVSPLFELEPLLAFADDSYVTKADKATPAQIKDKKKSLEAVTKCLRNSGLKVNQSKTELFLFHKNDTAQIFIKLNDASKFSSNVINVLEELFDSNLEWSNHVSPQANKALNTVKLICKF
jgi:hypothetical protein